jgi:hypothetical protein
VKFAKYIRYEINGRSVFVILDQQQQHSDVAIALEETVPVSAGLLAMDLEAVKTGVGSMTLKLPEDKEDAGRFKDVFQ